jgi:hypothetical protein
VFALRWSPRGDLLLSASADDKARVIHAQDGTLLQDFQAHDGEAAGWRGVQRQLQAA